MDLQREITVLTRRLNSQIMQRAGCRPLTTSIRYEPAFIVEIGVRFCEVRTVGVWQAKGSKK
jgi:hypothetical protein